MPRFEFHESAQQQPLTAEDLRDLAVVVSMAANRAAETPQERQSLLEGEHDFDPGFIAWKDKARTLPLSLLLATLAELTDAEATNRGAKFRTL